MLLQQVNPEEWNDVLQSYIRTKAVLEIRSMFYFKEKGTFTPYVTVSDKSYYLSLSEEEQQYFTPRYEYFQVKVATTQQRIGGVDALCGELWRFRNGKRDDSYRFDILMEWEPNLLGWITDCEDGGIMQALCGNVVAFTANVTDVLYHKFPRLYEWNRPDAPKEKAARKWLTK